LPPLNPSLYITEAFEINCNQIIMLYTRLVQSGFMYLIHACKSYYK